MKEEKTKTKSGVSRREFIAGATALGAVAGMTTLIPQVAAATLPAGSARASDAAGGFRSAQPVPVAAQPSSTSIPSSWDYEADVVVVGGGDTGMAAAVEAVELGASVIVVEQNFDIGGKGMINGGGVPLGGGTPLQTQLGITDSPELMFSDQISLTGGSKTIYYPDQFKWTDRELVQTYCNRSVETINWLTAHGVKFFAVGTAAMGSGNGFSAPRLHYPVWSDQGSAQSPGLLSTSSGVGPTGSTSGAGVIRPLEAAARSEGVQFLLNYKMVSIVRAPLSGAYQGRVLGVTANYTPTMPPGSTTPLQSYLSKGNISTTTPTLNIAAAKAVIIGTGGCAGNLKLRRAFDPRLTEEIEEVAPPWVSHTGEGILAAQAIGAQIWGTAGQTIVLRNVSKRTHIGCQFSTGSGPFLPGSPVFPFQRATGLSVADFQDCVLVNMAGQRFSNEVGTIETTPDTTFADQIMAQGGPVWAIFDSDAVTREKWAVTQGNVDITGGYFFSANTIADLAVQIVPPKGQGALPPYTIPIPSDALQATVTRYNSFVDSGTDSDFGKPTPKYKIQTAPFYAAFASAWIHETSVGLHINTSAQVLDIQQNTIPGLYAGGEATGGITIHGQGKALLFGRIAAENAVLETPWTYL